MDLRAFGYLPIHRSLSDDADAAQIITAIRLGVGSILLKEPAQPNRIEELMFFKGVMVELQEACVGTIILPKWIAHTTGGDVTIPNLLQIAGFGSVWASPGSFAGALLQRIGMKSFEKFVRWLERVGIPPAKLSVTGDNVEAEWGGQFTWVELKKVDRQKLTEEVCIYEICHSDNDDWLLREGWFRGRDEERDSEGPRDAPVSDPFGPRLFPGGLLKWMRNN
ncbi:hypothetical protein TWF281_001804 [Arthrobotrys megalospora]